MTLIFNFMKETDKPHYFGDGCSPPHRCPEGTCKQSYCGVCKVCNEAMPKECGRMILTPTPLHNGGMWCAERLPCRFHTKGEDGLSDEERRLRALNSE